MSKEFVKAVLRDLAEAEMPAEKDPWPAIRERVQAGYSTQKAQKVTLPARQRASAPDQPDVRRTVHLQGVSRHRFSTAAALIVLLALSAGVIAFLAGIVRLQPSITYGTIPACWSIVANPNIEGGDTVLIQISATSANDVWAVGYSGRAGATQTLVQRWDGKEWRTIPSANVPSRNNYLTGVAALAPDNVWVVGYHCTGNCSDAAPLIQHWDGGQWNTAPVQEMGRLNGIDAVSANDIWVVGYSNEGTISLHWNGQRWIPVPTNDQSVANRSLMLNAVVAIAADNVWAVGQEHDTQANSYTELIYRWDGARWTSVAGAGAAQGARLYAVAATSADDVWAVGDRDINPFAGAPLETLTQHWDGSTWRDVPSPNIGTGGSYLRGVEAISPTDVWALGGHGPITGTKKTLLLHWDGVAWGVVPSPNVEEQSNRFFGVEAISANEIWAVGTFNNTSTGAFVQRYNPCTIATPTPRTLIVPESR